MSARRRFLLSSPVSYQLITRSRRLLADTVTPVGLYLRLRDQYANCLLLESAAGHV